MRKSKFNETQIVAMLKDADSGVPVADLLRKHGVSKSTFFKWRSKYGGATVSDVKRLRELVAEHGRWGFWKCYDRIRLDGHPWNHKRLYRVRHTFCSHLAMRGAPPCAIQELAGHQDLATTQRYMHLSPSAVESAIRLLDQPAPQIDPARGDLGEVAIGATANANT